MKDAISTPPALLPKWGQRTAVGLLLLTPLLITPQVLEPYIVGKQTLVEMGALLLAFLWFHDRVSGRPVPVWRTPLDVCVPVLLLLAAGSLIWGWHDGGQLYRLRTLILWTLLAYLFVVLIRGGLPLERVQRWLGIPAILICVISLLQHFGWRGPIGYQPLGPDWRFAIIGTLGNPNFVSGYLAIVLPGIFVYGFYRASRAGFWFYFLPCWAAVAATLLATFTMGAWLALGCAGILLATAILRGRGLGWLPAIRGVAAAGVFLLACLWAFTDNTFNGPLEGGVLNAAYSSPKWKGGWGGRIFNWNVAIRMMDTHPLGGVGYGNFYAVNETYGGLVRESLGYVEKNEFFAAVDQPHQLPLELAAETGPLGAFVGWWIPIALLALGWRRLRREPDCRVDVLPAMLGVCISMVHGLVSFPMHLPASALATVYWAAVMAATPAKANTAEPKRGWILPGVLLTAAVMAWTALPFAAQVSAARPTTAHRYGTPLEPGEALRSVQRATQLDPFDSNHWALLASYMRSLQDDDAAIQAWERSLALAEQLHIRRAVHDARLRKGDLRDALEQQEAMVRLNPGHIPYWKELVFLRKELQLDSSEATKRLQDLVERSQE